MSESFSECVDSNNVNVLTCMACLAAVYETDPTTPESEDEEVKNYPASFHFTFINV